MRSYVYTISFPSGSIYVGKANCPEKRWVIHRSRALRGGSPLYCSLRKYNSEAVFEIVASCPSEADALATEKTILAQCKTALVCLNLTDGGDGPVGYKHTEQAREKISSASRGRPKPKTEQHRAKLSAASKGNKSALGRKHSEEAKEKMRAAWAAKKSK